VIEENMLELACLQQVDDALIFLCLGNLRCWNQEVQGLNGANIVTGQLATVPLIKWLEE
jgi:hypothetical protein